MKTFDKNDIYTVLEADEVQKTFLNAKGYFGDSLEGIRKAVEKNRLYTLDKVDTEPNSWEPYFASEGVYYALFLPSCMVFLNKPDIPLSLEQFNELFEIGEGIKIRLKADHSQIKDVCYVENEKPSLVMLGLKAYTLQELADNYEYFDFDDEWKEFKYTEADDE